MTEKFDLLAAFADLDKSDETRETILRAPFSYPGGKSRSVETITQHLPIKKIYVEPFGGSGAVLLARQKSKLEIFNDRYAGVVALYRVIRDPQKLEQFLDRMRAIIHSREEFRWCKDTWKTCADDVERAARWYYMTMCSFSSLGRNFGRSTSGSNNMMSKIRNKFPDFWPLHDRIKDVTFENQDWEQIVYDYDNEDAVFYMDPPYLTAYKGTYKHEMTYDEHRHLLDVIMKMKAFVAVSGFSNELYDSYKWDEKYTWDVNQSIKAMAFHEENYKAELKDLATRETQEEVLWIKH
jgi:DNA adenine methylase